jgi:hemerythrin-like domain-containing protein
VLLRGIHDHLRHELAQVSRAVEAAVTDARRAADVRALVNDLTMGVNYRALGSFCGRYCSVVAMHHRIEDAALFVDLADAEPDLAPVLERLSAEHVAVHDALVELDAGLVAMLTEQADALPRVQAALARLGDGLLDHLDYEERELLPALGRVGLAL